MDTWYRTLQKPPWTPPAWVFGPVWTALYLSMGVAAWLVWRRGWGRPPVRLALAVFGAQLLVNLLWSVVFFGLRRPGWAVADIAVLWVLLVATVVLFSRVRPAAGLVLLPYLAWVTFAAALNGAVAWLNR